MVRRLSTCSHEILSCISNTYVECYESWLHLESQPLGLDLLLGFMFENECAYHMKNSEETITISSAATIVKYYRYLTQEDMLLLCANCWLQRILHLFCLEWNTMFSVKVAVCVFTWGVSLALPCKRKTTLPLHIQRKMKMPWNVKSLKNMCCSFIWQRRFVKLSILLINQTTTQYHFYTFLL